MSPIAIVAVSLGVIALVIVIANASRRGKRGGSSTYNGDGDDHDGDGGDAGGGGDGGGNGGGGNGGGGD